MSILRDIQPVAKVTAVFVFALSIAAILTLLSPRAAHAEGFLYGTVRCLLQTVLTAECRPPSSAAPSPAPAPAQAPSTSQPSSSSQASKPATPRTTEPNDPYFAPLPEPDGTPINVAVIEDVPSKRLASAGHIEESEYLAYFNAYSKYSSEHEQAVANKAAIIQTGSEGWKVFGVAWYWWAIGVAAMYGLFLSVKYGILRRGSVLSREK